MLFAGVLMQLLGPALGPMVAPLMAPILGRLGMLGARAASTVPVVRKLRRATEFAIEWVGMHGAPHAVKFRVFLP